MSLSVHEIGSIWKGFMGELSRDNIPVKYNKNVLKDAITAIDDWIENNMASFNNAIPADIRGKLTSKQKIQLLFYVIKKRWEVG